MYIPVGGIMSRRFSQWTSLVCIAVLLEACSGCPGLGGGALDAVPVVVQSVAERQSSPQVTVFGVVNPSNRADIQFPRPVKIDAVLVATGATVAIGTPLLKLSSDDLTLQLNQLRAQKREQESAAPNDSYGRAAEATLDRIKTDIAAVEYGLSNLTVTSPIAGQVVTLAATPGMQYAAKDILLTIATMDPVTLIFPVASDDVQGVSVGTPITIKMEDGELPPISTTVSYIGPTVNPVSKTFDAWASLPNPLGHYKFNMRATVEFTSSVTHKVFAVPAASLTLREHDATLFLVKDRLARQTRVVLREVKGSEAILDSGVQSGDLVIVQGWERLHDGSPVDLRR